MAIGSGHPNRTIGNPECRNWIFQEKGSGSSLGEKFRDWYDTREDHRYATDRGFHTGKISEEFAHFHLDRVSGAQDYPCTRF